LLISELETHSAHIGINGWTLINKFSPFESLPNIIFYVNLQFLCRMILISLRQGVIKMNFNVISGIYKTGKMRKHRAAALSAGSKEEKSRFNLLQCQFLNATRNKPLSPPGP